MKLKTKYLQAVSYTASALLMPVLIIQAIVVRLTVLRLPEPIGKRFGQCGEGNALNLLIIGDSAAAGVGVEKQNDALAGQLTANLATKYKVNWSLIANTGFTSSDVLKALTALPEQTFDYVIVSVGVNDVTHLTRANNWAINIKAMVELLHSKFGEPKILMTSVPPMHQFTAVPAPLRWMLGLRAKQLNELMTNATKDKARYSQLTFDFPFTEEYLAKDGFHPSKLAYSIWANQAAERVMDAD